MDPSWVFTLPADVTVAVEAPGRLLLRGPDALIRLRQLPSGLEEALRRLAAPGEAGERLAASILARDGPDTLKRWFYELGQLVRRHWLHFAVDTAGDRLATLVPTAAAFAFTPAPALTGRPCVLSRFCWMRRLGDALVLESSLSCARVVLRDPRAVALVHALVQPRTVADLGGGRADLPLPAVTALVGLLAKAGAVSEVGDDGTADEDKDRALRCWEFHDLLFHTRSRAGRHDGPLGATYPVAEQLPPPAVRKTENRHEGIELHRPDLEQLQHADPPFARVQEQRRSLRHYGTQPITNRQLGEFLFRVGRVKECQALEVTTPRGRVAMDFASRPYPAGGGLYEQEMYVVVQDCRELAAGLYHYDPSGHRLERLAGRNGEVEQLLSDAGRAAGLEPDRLQILLIMTARLPRLAWKYSGLAYALVLKHVGVVCQTMYLAATAMGLAPCALGAGDADLFARAAGVDYYAETSVGEFLLGSKPD